MDQIDQAEEDDQVTVAVCDQCSCSSISVIKKGFSAQNAIFGFIGGSVATVIIYSMSISSREPSLLLIAAASLCLPLLGVFIGTIDMNNLFVVCLNCGYKKPLAPYEASEVANGEASAQPVEVLGGQPAAGVFGDRPAAEKKIAPKPAYSLQKNKYPVRWIVAAIIAIASFWYYFGGGQQLAADNMMQNIHDRVTSSAEKQYYIALRQGDRMQIYNQACQVAIDYLQANDEPNYDKWKAIADSAGILAGIPVK